MQTMRDFLVWYNNRDVTPFVEALEKQKAFYKNHQLDMCKDAMSLPNLAEKIMYQIAHTVSEPLELSYVKLPEDLILTGRNLTAPNLLLYYQIIFT